MGAGEGDHSRLQGGWGEGLGTSSSHMPLSPREVSPMTAPAMLLRPHSLAMWCFQPSEGSVCSPVKGCFLPLMEDRNARMESTNLCVALRALVYLWSEKQRKILAVPLAQHGMAQPGVHPSVPIPAQGTARCPASPFHQV